MDVIESINWMLDATRPEHDMLATPKYKAVRDTLTAHRNALQGAQDAAREKEARHE